MYRWIMGWDMGIWMVFNLIFWILVIAGIVLLVVWVGQKGVGAGSRAEESALEILKKRYARGEISKTEYEGRRNEIWRSTGQGLAHGQRKERTMNQWVARSVVMIIMLSLGSTVSAQMEKEGTGKHGMTGKSKMGKGMMDGGGGGMGMGMMGMHGPGMEMGGMGEMMKMMRAVSKLDLTADQTKKLQLSTLQHQKEAIPLFGQIRLAGVEIQELLLAEPANLDKVKSKVKEKYDAAAKLEMSHLALMQEVKKLLTPEQRQRMESMMMEIGPMRGSSSGQAQDDESLQGAPNGPTDDASDSKDPHGH